MKRILCIILAACMLVSLLPSIALASEGDSGTVEPIVAEFLKNPSYTGTTKYAIAEINGSGFSVDTDNSTKMKMQNYGDNIMLQLWHSASNSTLYSWPSTNVQNLKFTIKINAPTAGYYNTDFDYTASNLSARYTAYINGVAAGEIDGYVKGANATEVRSARLNTVYLNEGDNTVSFRMTKTYMRTNPDGTESTVKNNAFWFYPKKLTFTYLAASFSEPEYTHNLPQTMYIGQTAEFTVSAKTGDGTPYFFGKYNDDGKESANPFISLSEADEFGKVSGIVQTSTSTSATFTAQKEGIATIKASSVIDGKTVEKDINVRVRAQQPLDHISLTFDKETIPATRTAQATVSVFDDEDGEFTADYEASFESLDTDIATVTAGENKNEAIITGVSKGTARIKVTVIPRGNEDEKITQEKEITVSDAPVIKTLTLSTDKETYIIGSEGTFTLSGTMSDGLPVTEADIAKIDVIYENDNENVISLNAVEKKFAALSQGDAEISAIAEVAGEKIFARRIVNVVADGDPIVANFAKTVLVQDKKLTGAITEGFKIVDDKSTTRGARVALEGKGLQINHWVTPATSGIAWPAQADKNLMFTISVEAEKAGYYSPELIYEAYNKSGDFVIYVNDRFAGEVNAYAPGQKKGVQQSASLNTVYLDYGTNEISFRLVKAYPREDSGKYDGVWFILDKLTLTPCGDTLSVKSLSHNLPEKLCRGQIVDFSVSAIMSDNTTKLFGKYNEDGTEVSEENVSLSVTSEVGEISDVEQTADGVKGKLSVQNAGTVTVKAMTNAGGEPFEETIAIEVLDEALETTRPEISGTVFKDDVIELKTVNTLTNGAVWDIPSSYTVFSSGNPQIASIEGNVFTAHGTGTVTITATTTLAGVTQTGSIDITILDEDVKTLELTAGGSIHLRLTGIEGDTIPMYVKGITNKGNEVEFAPGSVQITYEALTPEIATIDETGNITPHASGNAKFKVTVIHRGREISSEVIFSSAKAKTHSTYYTKAKKENAIENISKYSWAKSSAKSTIAAADRYVSNIDILYDLIPSNEIPRASTLGEYGDPEAYYCTYCGCDIQSEYNSYGWTMNAVTRPWKMQCPDCKRLFPSNDFESFYQLGLNEYGEFSRERALLRHHKRFVCADGENCTCTAPAMSEQTHSDGKLNRDFYAFYGYGVEGGYLHNDLYEDVAEEKTVNRGRGVVAENGEDPSFWGVDDSLGYLTGYRHIDSKGNVVAYERHAYIALYAHYGLFRKAVSGGGAIAEAMTNCFQAYLYTGDEKYGRVAAVLIDRIADFYPDYDLTVFYKTRRIFVNSDGGNKNGKILGNIWETDTAKNLCEAYDAVYELYDDPEVLKFLQDKGKAVKFRHAKETPSQIRTNIEDGILRTSFEGLSDGSIAGNFGYDQRTNAMAAVVLDSQPETRQWLEFMMAPGWVRMKAGSTGGSITENLYEKIDWDGQGDEASSYNANWLDYLIDASLILAEYENNEGINLFEDPKFVKMFYGMLNVTMTDYGAQTGDSGTFAGKGLWLSEKQAMAAYRYIKDDVFLQALYVMNGYSSDGIHENIFTKNPEQIKEDMDRVISEKGTLSLDSEMLSGFGFAALRDGKRYSKTDDTRRGFWMFFGLSGAGHGHRDSLNIGMDAFGLNFLPDLGYPTTADSQPRVLQWEARTLSHNTVMVNEQQQRVSQQRGKSLHFDASENVQLMDVEAPDVYNDCAVSEYRRSVIMVKIDEDNFYGLDLFRVKGGWSHEFSLHAQSDEIGYSSGVNFIPQGDENGRYKGNYAGIDVDSDPTGDGYAGPDPNSPITGTYETVYPRGYTWLENVDRGAPTSDKIELEFNIKDFKKSIVDSKGLYLRATMLGIEPDSEINTATGYVPKKPKNNSVPGVRYAFVKRKSEDKNTHLDTLFTTVYEPYRNTRTLSDISLLPMNVSSGTEEGNDIARCVKVTHADGERADYIFYATNNKVTYTVTDGEKVFTFRGFVGVITMNNGADIYKYICDGDILDEAVPQKKAIEARVTYFTESSEFENEIHIKPLYPVDAEMIPSLTGRYVYVENGNVRNAAYKIESAQANGDEIILNIGDCTLITGQIDPYAEDKVGNYRYNITKRADCVIPLSWSEDNAPLVDEVTDKSVSAGSTLSFTLNGSSPIENMSVSLSLRTAPRGACLNSETGTFTWKPDSSQVGTHVITVVATDADGRQSVKDFKVEVYGSTTGASSAEKSQGTAGAGGGGGGGGAAPDTGESDKTDVPNDEETIPSDENSETSPDASGETDNIRFTDLGNHTWAEEAINTLADDGIIKGTSAKTYSPANNITRADFALLLVRAFNLSSDNTENFADVSASDYFASELATARNTGIVQGIGDNKYAPLGTITRQDMMVITYRALQALGNGETLSASAPQASLREGGVTDVPAANYPDWENVAPYAREAVASLIGAGNINGKNGRIAPTDYTTRAEVAVLIKRILDYTKK